MPFRAKIKKVFGGSSSSSDSSSLNTTKTSDSNVYKPGEVIPQPKYRGKVDPEHKATLESFSFGDTFRRKSGQSQYSPQGTRMPSRNNSVQDEPRRMFGMGGKRKSQVPQVTEDADDTTDAANVGGSRFHSFEAPSERLESTQAGLAEPGRISSHKDGQNANASDHQPFTEADLTQAMTHSSRRNE